MGCSFVWFLFLLLFREFKQQFCSRDGGFEHRRRPEKKSCMFTTDKEKRIARKIQPNRFQSFLYFVLPFKVETQESISMSYFSSKKCSLYSFSLHYFDSCDLCCSYLCCWQYFVPLWNHSYYHPLLMEMRTRQCRVASLVFWASVVALEAHRPATAESSRP